MQLWHNFCLYKTHNVLLLLALSEMCNLNDMFIIAVLVMADAELDCIILRRVSIFLSLSCTYMGGAEYPKHLQYNTTVLKHII